MITEKIIDNARLEKGGVYGQIHYEYHSPTHVLSTQALEKSPMLV